MGALPSWLAVAAWIGHAIVLLRAFAARGSDPARGRALARRAGVLLAIATGIALLAFLSGLAAAVIAANGPDVDPAAKDRILRAGLAESLGPTALGAIPAVLILAISAALVRKASRP